MQHAIIALLEISAAQLPSKVQYKTGNFAVIAYFDTREMFARMNAARKQTAL